MKGKTITFIVLAALLILGVLYWEPNVPVEKEQQPTWHNADENMILVDLIRPGVTVLQKFTVSGQARGPWYFEASFPVEVLDADGKQIAVAPAQAQEEWMTEAFVPFRVELDVGSYSGDATLILRKDNPSGEPERDASVSFPVVVFDPKK